MILSNTKDIDSILEAMFSLRENPIISEDEKSNIKKFYIKIMNTMQSN